MNRVPSHSRINRRGSTLLEMIVSLISASVLLIGMGSTMYITLRATDIDATPTAAVVAGNDAVTELLSDIEFAQGFSEQTATAITFTVPDRDGDTITETIRYAWSGTPGDPLTQQVNGGPVTIVVDNVYVFQHDLPAPNPNLLMNPDMESGTTGWEPIPNSYMYSQGSVVHSGAAALYDYKTGNNNSGVRQNVTAVISNGTEYELQGWMRKWSAAAPFNVKLQLRITSTGSGTQVFASDDIIINNSSFILGKGVVTPTWSGTLVSAYFEACGATQIQEIYLDDASLRTYQLSNQTINVRLQVGSNASALIHAGVGLLNSPL